MRRAAVVALILPLVAACREQRAPDGFEPSSRDAASQATPRAPRAGPLSVPASFEVYDFRLRDQSKHIIEELTDCVSAGACPPSDVGKAARKAARAFGCSSAEVELSLRDDLVGDRTERAKETYFLPEARRTFFIPTGGSVESAEGAESFLAQRGTSIAYEVACGGFWGLVVCATGNRSVRTPDTTYENTADRVCLWGRVEHEMDRSARAPRVRDEPPTIR